MDSDLISVKGDKNLQNIPDVISHSAGGVTSGVHIFDDIEKLNSLTMNQVLDTSSVKHDELQVFICLFVFIYLIFFILQFISQFPCMSLITHIYLIFISPGWAH